jgi:3-hydroxy-3-methylglutaryl CoA synthase
MMGIVSYGVHIPRYRLSNKCIADAWGRPSTKGEKAVANFDEDSLTMGVDSSLNCLRKVGIEVKKIDGLFFSSTTPSYREKFSSSVIAMAIDLSCRIRSTDYLGSLRSSTSAILGAMDAIKSQSCENVLVVGSDCRLAEPGSPFEGIFGDGSVSLLLGKDDVIASIIASFSISDEFTDLWRRDEDLYVRQDDVRFAQQYGYTRLVSESINGVLSTNGYKPKDFSKIVLPPIDARSHIGLARKLGFDTKTQLQDALIETTGITGTAHYLLLLAAALEDSRPGDKILFASYGDGSDAFILEVTENISKVKGQGGISKGIEGKRALNSYTKYLSFHNLIRGQKPLTEPFSSLSIHYRERDQNLKLYGRRCKRCKLVQFLRDIHVCPGCYAQDEFEPIKLSKKGTLFTFNHEYYYPSPDTPTTMALVDFPEGARILMQMTDTDIEQVKIGMPVELTFRKYHDGNYFHNYFWKCRVKLVSSG